MSTVAAISTPLSASGLGVVRISGEDAVTAGERMFRPFREEKNLREMRGYSCAYGRVYDSEGDIDEAVATVFLAPKSYTGENTVEFSCHGSPALLKRVLRAAFSAGALPAGPGEFTKRAFLNGKLTLTQAEAVMDIISAKSAGAGKAALTVRDGALYKKIKEVCDSLTALESHFAAWSDYPEEDVEELSEEHMLFVLKETDSVLKKLIAGYDGGRILREGAAVVIAGKPNVGKSTIMNLLSGRNRSIVTEIAGTTRDVVEEAVLIVGVPIRLLDTAGLRETENRVEKLGVEIANSEIERCDMAIAVFDSAEPLSAEDFALVEKLKDKTALAVVNKSDLETRADIDFIKKSFANCVLISAAGGKDDAVLKEAIAAVLGAGDIDPAEAIMANERQLDCAKRAERAVAEAIEAIEGKVTLDAVSICNETALEALYELTGEKASEAVIEQVFSRFCVGK